VRITIGKLELNGIQLDGALTKRQSAISLDGYTIWHVMHPNQLLRNGVQRIISLCESILAMAENIA
jgi:hypothetical protein